MKTRFGLAPNPKNSLLYILAYLLWLVNALVCGAAVIQLSSIVTTLWVVFKGEKYTLSLVNQVGALLAGFVAFVYVMFLEGYYRASLTPQSVAKSASVNIQTQPLVRLIHWWTQPSLGTLLRRFIITTAIPLLVCLLSLAILELALHHILF
jgi:hypothetical protein